LPGNVPQPHVAPGDQQARAAIDRGAAEVRQEDGEQNHHFSNKSQDADDRDRKIQSDVD